MSNRQALIQDFLTRTGWGDAQRGTLAGDASFRHYDRLNRNGERAVLMDAPPPQEDVRPFLKVARHLLDLGYSAPAILAEDSEAGLLLLEDLGDDTFTRLLAKGEDEEDLYWLAIDMLMDLHGKGAKAILPGLPSYDDERLLTEALLLTDWYIPEMIGGTLTEAARQDYVRIWRNLIPSARRVPETIVLRDFHVDNLLRLDRPTVRACGVLDFQDAVIGPITYDLMSLLEDARRDIPPDLISGQRQRYLDAFPSLDKDAFDTSWAILAAQRHAKVIGIFTRLCRRDGKPLYLGHIPRVWRLLEAAVEHPELAELRHWLDQNIPKDKRRVPQP